MTLSRTALHEMLAVLVAAMLQYAGSELSIVCAGALHHAAARTNVGCLALHHRLTLADDRMAVICCTLLADSWAQTHL